MPSLDTNVLVRLLVDDDPAQGRIAARLIRRALRQGQPLFVPLTVALELEWVLRSSFGFAKPEVVAALAGLLSSVELEFQSESALEFALAQYQVSSGDFADCLHIALAVQAGAAPLWTFDRAASRMSGAELAR